MTLKPSHEQKDKDMKEPLVYCRFEGVPDVELGAVDE
jgi:hypothetical protein